MIRIASLMVSVAVFAWAAPTQAQVPSRTLDIRTPEAFAATLTRIGYDPGPMTLRENGTSPAWHIRFGGFDTEVYLWGCEQLKNCLYVTFAGHFDHLVRMPSDTWLLKQSDHYSTTKVGHSPWIGNDLRILIGQIGQGMPVDQFKFMITDWNEDVAYLKTQLEKDGYLLKRGAGKASD